MSLQNIPLDNIGEADIQRLLSIGVTESPYLDYKQESYGDAGNDRSEFLADISSFANTLGGDLVIGVAETNGLPTSLTPFQGDYDAEKQRLEQIALSGLEPRISNLRTHSVPITAGGHVIIVRVPRSFTPPHRVIARDSNRFWARAGTMKYQPNVEQLRPLFNDAPHFAERIRAFQTDRLIKITAGDTPIPMNQTAKVVVHVIPVPSFADGRMIDMVSVLSRDHLPTPLDDLNMPAMRAVNLDGYLNYAAPGNYRGARQAYAQFFRNGGIEGVGELRSDDGVNSRFVGKEFTGLIVTHVRQYLQVLKFYETGLPVYIFLSFCNAAKMVYRHAPEGFVEETRPLGREIAAFPEIYVDTFDLDVPAVMRPVFNVVWNAFGLAQCEIYDSQGKLRGE
jgi:Putative DNA-binding domain